MARGLNKSLFVTIAAIALIGAALRMPGMFTDFWLDEIWSLNIAKSIHSPMDVLLSEPARIDNNHPLITWTMQAAGDVTAWWIYRIPALLCGIGSIIAAAIAMSRRSAIEAIAAGVLITFSYPLVFYSSEARGYAPAAFFTLVAFVAMLRYVERPSWLSAIIFNLACVLGFLSHLTFMHFYLAALYWTILRARRTQLPVAQQLLWWARLNVVPIVFVVILYRVFVRDMTIGGASPTDPMRVLIRTLSITLGGFDFGIGAMICAAIAGALFIGALAWLMRQRDDLWFFYLLAVIVAPACLLVYNLVLSQKPQPLMPRYFLVATTMLLMAIAHLAPAILRTGAPGRVSLAMLGFAFVGGNLAHVYRFLQEGRGGYSQAIARMLEGSPDQVVTVASDNVFRSGPTIEFYRSRIVPANRGIDFYPADFEHTGSRPHPPEWTIVTSTTLTQNPAKTLTAADGTIYRLVSSYPCDGLSGFTWVLYRIDINATIRGQQRR